MLTSKPLAGSVKQQAIPYGTSPDVNKQALKANPYRTSPDVNKQAVGRVSEEASYSRGRSDGNVS